MAPVFLIGAHAFQIGATIFQIGATARVAPTVVAVMDMGFLFIWVIVLNANLNK
jgi:hypothetical protein